MKSPHLRADGLSILENLTLLRQLKTLGTASLIGCPFLDLTVKRVLDVHCLLTA